MSPFSQAAPPLLPGADDILAGPVLEQLAAGAANWNDIYGDVVRLTGFRLLGRCATRPQRDAVRGWLAAHSVFPTGNADYPESLELHAIDEATDESAAATLATIDDRLALGDQVVEISWSRGDADQFKTLAIADREGLRYDSLLTNVATSGPVEYEPDERHTDCVDIRIGWIWQRQRQDMTRGRILLCLSAECDAAGRLVRCPEPTRFMFMQLGSVDGDVINVRRVGNCCVALCAWAWATATITVKVKAKYGGLEIEISGGFGTVGKGGRELKDCCPKGAAQPVDEKPQQKPVETPAGGEHPHTVERPPTVTPGADGTTVVTLPDGTVIINNPGGPIIVTHPGGSPEIHWPPSPPPRPAAPVAPPVTPSEHLPHKGWAGHRGRRPDCGEEFEVDAGGYGDSKSEASRNAEENADEEAWLLCPLGCRPPKRLSWVITDCDHAPGGEWYCRGVGRYRCLPK